MKRKIFKPRSLWVKLPCANGDTVFIVNAECGKEKIISAVVEDIGVTKHGGMYVYLRAENGSRIVNSTGEIFRYPLFLTIAEAEKTLKQIGVEKYE